MTHSVENFSNQIRHTTSHIKSAAARDVTESAIALYATAFVHVTASARPAIAASALGSFGSELMNAVERVVAELR
jgi:diacylglycerol kinase